MTERTKAGARGGDRPDDVFPSFRAVTEDYLLERGVRYLLVDIDNTLAPHGAWTPPDETVRWVRGLESAGIRCHGVSNGKARRIASFCGGLGIPFIARAGKPSAKPLMAAMDALGARPGETAAIGDQLSTDIRGARKAGVLALLVHPVSLDEPIGLRIRRRYETSKLRRILTAAQLERWKGRT